MPALNALNEAVANKRFHELLAKMDDDQREHFKLIVLALMECYSLPTQHALVIMGSDDTEDGEAKTGLFCVNASEIQAALLIQEAREYIDTSVMSDAPERSMYN